MPSVIERAYELASSGRCRTLKEVEDALSKEGYEQVHVHMRSPSLRRDLWALINKSNGPVSSKGSKRPFPEHSAPP